MTQKEIERYLKYDNIENNLSKEDNEKIEAIFDEYFIERKKEV
jgi:hypothetical protein